MREICCIASMIWHHGKIPVPDCLVFGGFTFALGFAVAGMIFA